MQPDLPTPRFAISLYNRAAGGELAAKYEAHQVPARGDLVIAHGGSLTAGTPFERQVVWRVDSVMWNVSTPGSHNAMAWARDRGLPLDRGCCWHVDLMVWPDMGPHWAETPPWAYSRPEDEDEAGEQPHAA